MSGRMVGIAVFVLLTLLCGYFFLAGLEYPGVTAWKLFTGGLGVFFLLIAFMIAKKKRIRP